jgi:RNA polymerase sigma factor (sigma-70 family)
MSPLEINITEIFSRIDYHTTLAVKRRLIRAQEVDDLQQDIIIALFIRVNDFNPNLAAWSTFINVVIESEIKQFRLRKRWQKHQEFISVHELEDDEHPLINFYPTYELNDQEPLVFLGEIRSVIATLPEELQKLCQLLLIDSKTNIVERLHISSVTFYREIEKIRLFLGESKIIQDFFKNF